MMADEYIRREDFIQHLEKCKKGAAVTNLVWAAIMAIERDVRDMPAADVAPVVHGKWVHSRYDRSSGQFDVVKCSRCGIEAYAMAYHVRDGNYCPRCGARMDGGNEDDP